MCARLPFISVSATIITGAHDITVMAITPAASIIAVANAIPGVATIIAAANVTATVPVNL
jgi:hypothetical protein